jgi:hypothetical protein
MYWERTCERDCSKPVRDGEDGDDDGRLEIRKLEKAGRHWHSSRKLQKNGPESWARMIERSFADGARPQDVDGTVDHPILPLAEGNVRAEGIHLLRHWVARMGRHHCLLSQIPSDRYLPHHLLLPQLRPRHGLLVDDDHESSDRGSQGLARVRGTAKVRGTCVG